MRRARIVCDRIAWGVLLILFAGGVYLWAGTEAPAPMEARPENSTPGEAAGFYAGENESAPEGAAADTPPAARDLNENAGTLPYIESFDPQRHGDMDLIGVNDIVFQPETTMESALESIDKEAVTTSDTEKLYDFEYMRRQFYITEEDTGLLPSDVDADFFLNADLSLDLSVPGPKVLIFHTHSNEMFRDSNPSDPMTGIMGTGRRLAEILRQTYGVEALHHTGRYDIVDGRSQIGGAYERMAPPVEQILRDNPSIQLAIDLHRDGLGEGAPLMLTEVNGKRTARIMFVNGLCRMVSNGELTPVPWLQNPYIPDNMALSFRLQLQANALFPDFTRKIFLKAFRYSLNMLPKSLIVEVGAQTNSLEEALNAMEPLAEILARTVLP